MNIEIIVTYRLSISLYTCVANGSTDEFVKAEALQQAKAVQNMLQIGFHLSAQVHEINSMTTTTTTTATAKISSQYYHVSIIFDRKKITSCHCTCNNSCSWCSHIVAVCICRIAQVRCSNLVSFHCRRECIDHV
jgi:hypothetical protein